MDRLPLTPSQRMLKMLQAFHRIYSREHGELSDQELIELYDQLALYMSELHDDCLAREINRKKARRGFVRIVA